jgi:integrase
MHTSLQLIAEFGVNTMASIFQRSGVWRAQARRDGRVISRSFDTRADAIRWATEYENPPPPKPKTIAEMTVADLMDRYAREISPRKKGGRWEVYRLTALAPAFPMAATQCDGATIAEWRDGRLKQVTRATVNRELNLISAVFTIAIKEWRLPSPVNPVHTIIRPAGTPPRRRRVADHELQGLLAELAWNATSAPTDLNQWVAWVFSFALETMMRKGEILGMTWQHVYPKRVHLPDTKNGDSRDVPLSAEARRLLALLTRGESAERVCQIESGTLDRYFREARERAGIADLHFHDSRREALTRTSKKLSMIELMQSVGHRDTRSVSIYYQPDPDEIADKL